MFKGCPSRKQGENTILVNFSGGFQSGFLKMLANYFVVQGPEQASKERAYLVIGFQTVSASKYAMLLLFQTEAPHNCNIFRIS